MGQMKADQPAESILFIHGSACDSSFYHASAEILADYYQIILYDRRGYGLCPKPLDDDYSLHAQVSDALSAITSSNVNQVWIVAHSAGALIALEMASRYPKLVSGLILVEPPLAFSESTAQRISSWSAEIETLSLQRKYAKAFMLFLQGCGDNQSLKVGDGSLQDVRNAYINFINYLNGECDVIMHFKPDKQLLQSIICPVDIIVSEFGEKQMFGITSHELSDCMNWPIQKIPGTHNAPKEYPEIFAQIVNNLILGKTHI